MAAKTLMFHVKGRQADYFTRFLKQAREGAFLIESSSLFQNYRPL